MDNETVRHLWALRKVNNALLDGLKLAIYALENEGALSNKRRKSMIKSLNRLITQSEEIYATTPTEH